jgi:hypothetical protein
MSEHRTPTPENRPIILRAFAGLAKPASKRKKSFQRKQATLGASDWSAVIDCETTTDPGQALRFGFCRVYFREQLRREICFYRQAALPPRELALLNRYAEEAQIEAMPCEEFMEVFYKYGYHLRAMIVGFNLPFDLARLAIAHSVAHPTKWDSSMHGGFSLKLSPHSYCPPVQVKHLSRYVSFIRFAGYHSQTSRSQRKRGKSTPVKRGYFLDVRTLAAALLSRSFSLASLAEFLNAPRKHRTEEHGKALSNEYLEYARQDVATTWECFKTLKTRYEAMSLETPINRIFSEASLGKAHFDKMGIKPWTSLQPDVPQQLLGKILSTFFGGRSEVRIRREMRQVVLCDFLSMYPTVCTLMNLWRFVVANGMRWRDGTGEIKRLLKTCRLENLQSQETWKNLVALVQVRPDSDILPVRAAYDTNADGTIGANYLTSKRPMWFTLADCLAAQLLTGKPVRVLKAIVFQPCSAEIGLNSISVGDSQIVDPYRDDLYKTLIEGRQTLKKQRDNSTSDEYARLDTRQNAIKIAANATSYGIFAEINVNDSPNEQRMRIFGGCDQAFLHSTTKEEQPGRFFHPLLATTITGAARLMLAIAERLVTDAGLEWAFCDTDSIAIAKPSGMPDQVFHKKVNEVVAWFRQLNPYSFGGDILKIEDVNYGLKNPGLTEPLFVWAVSAKRYVLFNVKDGAPVIRKASAHGLGHLHSPYDEKNPAPGIPAPREKLSKIGVQLWQHDLWWTIAKAAVDGKSDHELKFDFHPGLKQPAMSRYAATTPKNLKWFDSYNEGRGYSEQMKPFGFVSALYAETFGDDDENEIDLNIKPVAPFDKDPKKAAKGAFDRLTGLPVSVKRLKRYQEALAQYHLHPEDKFLNGDYLDRGTTQRRHVLTTEIQYIGKESNKWEDQFYFGFDPEEEVRYGIRPASRKSIARAVRKIADALGLRDAAKEIGISRAKLSNLLENRFSGCSSDFMQRLSGIVRKANSSINQEEREKSELLKLAKREIRRIELSQFSARLGIDQANLAKMIAGTRKLSRSAIDRLRTYFDARGPEPPLFARGIGMWPRGKIWTRCA